MGVHNKMPCFSQGDSERDGPGPGEPADGADVGQEA